MTAWLIGAWSQIWPNLAASAISTATAVVWHHKRVRQLLAEHHEDLTKSLQGVRQS